jgi:hypothetical protein
MMYGMLKDVRDAGGCTGRWRMYGVPEDVWGAEEFSQVIMLACLFICLGRKKLEVGEYCVNDVTLPDLGKSN